MDDVFWVRALFEGPLYSPLSVRFVIPSESQLGFRIHPCELQWDSATHENFFCGAFSESSCFCHADKSGMLLLGLESVDVLRAAQWKGGCVSLNCCFGSL